MPSNRAEPVTRDPRLGSSPMIASEVTDLPQPDSPTSPTTWPGETSKLTPSTATVGGASPRRRRPVPPKVTRRSRTSSRGWSVIGRSPPALRVERLAQGLTEQREAERHQDDRHSWVERQLRPYVQVGLRVG